MKIAFGPESLERLKNFGSNPYFRWQAEQRINLDIARGKFDPRRFTPPTIDRTALRHDRDRGRFLARRRDCLIGSRVEYAKMPHSEDDD